MTSRRTRRILAAGAAFTLLTLGVGACSSSGDDESGSISPAAGGDTALIPDGGSQAQRDVADSDDVASPAEAPDEQPVDGRALIKTGNVALRSEDVAETRFQIRKILDANGGEVAEDTTEADEEGKIERVRQVLRVPAEAFDQVVEGIKAISNAELIAINTSSEDVTTQVIDTGVRVDLQRRSIERISLLLERAQSIRDIVNIERELARREADLGSLEKRQAFLADQTKLATITVSIERPKPETKVEEKKEKDDDGFFAGLNDGWDAFTSATTALLTASGAVLPFAILLLVLFFPLRLLTRRLIRRLPSMTPATPAVDGH